MKNTTEFYAHVFTRSEPTSENLLPKRMHRLSTEELSDQTKIIKSEQASQAREMHKVQGRKICRVKYKMLESRDIRNQSQLCFLS